MDIPEVGEQLPEWWIVLRVDEAWGNGWTRYLLTQYWLNLRVLS